MASISGSFLCSPSHSRRCRTIQQPVSMTGAVRTGYFCYPRYGAWQVNYPGQGRALSISQHQVTLKKGHVVGGQCLELVSCSDYEQIKAPVLSKRLPKNGVMLIDRLLKLCSNVSPAKFYFLSKRNSPLVRFSSSKMSISTGPVNSETYAEAESKSNISNEDQLLSSSSMNPSVNEERINGRSGFASFYTNGVFKKDDESFLTYGSQKTKSQSLLWLAAPVIFVASIVIPPIVLRPLIEMVLDDTLATDFVILFFTEVAFYAGAYVFLFITQKLWVKVRQQKPDWSLAVYLQGYKVSSLTCLILSVMLPILSIYVVWPWIGPAAAAALVPYLGGLLVQLWFEESMKDSRFLPHIQVIFQVYRLHQLNRGAQLAAGLLFTLKGIETTAETMAINGALQTLMTVIQLLGILCLWSLGSFLVQTSFLQHQPQAQAGS